MTRSSSIRSGGHCTTAFAALHEMPTYDFHVGAYDDWTRTGPFYSASGVETDNYLYSSHKSAASPVSPVRIRTT